MSTSGSGDRGSTVVLPRIPGENPYSHEGIAWVKDAKARHSADLFTKILSRQVFEKHRKKVLNLPGDTCSESARKMRFLSGEQANCFADPEWSPLTAVVAGSQGGSVTGETRSRRRRSSRKGRRVSHNRSRH